MFRGRLHAVVSTPQWGPRAHVVGVIAGAAGVGVVTLRRLGELGFIGGEPVQVLRCGPGGREPLAVQVGQTLFALSLLEAECIEVQADDTLVY
jgi:ferrous iron transport protein A